MLLISCADDPTGLSEGDCERQYSMSQLEAWYARTSPILFEVEGVTMTDLDEAKGCIMFGLANRGVVADVAEKLKDLRIPRDAVYFEIVVGGVRD
jgi:hypothetical protein